MKKLFSLFFTLCLAYTSIAQLCTASVSTISTTDDLRICVDGVPDPIDVSIDIDGGSNSVWVVTDPTGFIFATYPPPPFDFDNAGPGICLIWLVNTDDPAFTVSFGQDISTVVANTPCTFLSNSLAVDRIVVTAATISTPDPLTICVDDGVDEPINVTINNAGTAPNGAWVITDATGTIVALPAAPPFVLDGAGVGTCSIWWVNYDDPAFAPDIGDDAAAIVAAALCAELSNPITITRENCTPPCTASVSTISTTDDLRICVDGVPDPIDVSIDVDGGSNSVWVVTDPTGFIFATYPPPPFDFDNAGPGICLIWLVNTDDPAFTVSFGQDISTVVANTPCTFLSNSIAIDRIEVTAATISTLDPLTICVDDGIDEPINVTINNAGTAPNGAWVITDATGTIVALPTAPPFVLDGAGVGTCSIWWVNYDDPSFAPAVGDDAAAIVAASLCAELSNPITITRENCTPPCTAVASAISTTDPTRICVDGVGDPINVTVDTDGGGTGAWVITDAAGMILALPPGPPFDLDGAGVGQCLIWYVNFDDANFAPAVGDDAAAIVAVSTCAFLSNAITVDRIEVTAATISTMDALTICVDDGVDEPINVTIDNAGVGANGAWVITDATGAIVSLPAAPPFVLDGAGVGTCSIWWVNYDDPAFAPAVGDDAAAIVGAATCATLSNPITIVRENCMTPCGLTMGSTISTTDPTTICIDGVGDPINVSIDTDAGGTGVWVITDAAGIILAFPPGPPFDLDGAGAGTCLIRYVNTEDGNFNPMVGDDAAVAAAASDCTLLSNAITVDRIEVTGATISSSSGDPITICTTDGVDEPVDVNIDDAGIGANGAWVITDSNGIILALPAGPPFVLDGAGPGTCLIWWVNYDDANFAPVVGDDAAALVAAATCAALSNPITVNRDDNCEPCEDGISGFVTAEDTGCSAVGIEVTIYDAMGTVVGTATTDASGNYILMGLYPCGSYTAELTANVPDCYVNSGGVTGPIGFNVDGDGNPDGADFGENPQVPTLSQWGLISLALLLMIVGSLKMSAVKFTHNQFKIN